MLQHILIRLGFLLCFFRLTLQTNIEFFDTASPEHAHIFQKCRFLNSGDCCVPVDFILPNSNRQRFTPYRIVFEYFSKNALFVYAGAGSAPACSGPSVDGYIDPSAQLNVKDFISRPGQRFSGAMFTQTGGISRIGNVRYPWSIEYKNVLYYQSPSNPLFYSDRSARHFLRAIPQDGRFDQSPWPSVPTLICVTDHVPSGSTAES